MEHGLNTDKRIRTIENTFSVFNPCSSVARNSAFRISDFPLRSQMLSQQIGALLLQYLFKDLSIG